MRKSILSILAVTVLLALTLGTLTVSAEATLVIPDNFLCTDYNNPPVNVDIDTCGLIDQSNPSVALSCRERGLIGDFSEPVTLTGFKVAFSSFNEEFDSTFTWSVSDDGKTWTVIDATIAEKKEEQIENANIWDFDNPILTDTVYYYSFGSAVTARYFMIRSSVPDEWPSPISMVDARVSICNGLYDADNAQNGPGTSEDPNQGTTTDPSDGPGTNPNAGTADFAIISVAVAAVALTGIALVSKKRK